MSRQGSPTALLLGLFFCSFLATAWRDASAQYMYLDANGDAVHTDADVIAPAGTTPIDVYIRTDANRDGTPVTCGFGTASMSIFSYEFVLQVIDGTVQWGSFSNNPPNSLPAGPMSTETGFLSGVCLIHSSPPGLHRLATMSLQVVSGTPSVFIVPQWAPDPARFTAFGSACSGPRGDSTFALGRDWFDTDGLRYGGWTHPPSLTQPAGMTVAEGRTADQVLEASDPDGSAVSISKSEGPEFMSVVGDPAGGWAIRLAPGYSDAGAAIGRLVASDGTGKDFRSFAIRVLNTNRPPVLELPSPCVEQGETKHFWIRATDPDADLVTFEVGDAPDFVEFSSSWSGHLPFLVAPSHGDSIGARVVRITAIDGSDSVTEDLEIRVEKLGGCSGLAPLVARVSPNPMRAGGTLTFWTSIPGPLRVTLHDARGRVARTLLDERHAPAGYHHAFIPAYSPYGAPRLASGVYFYRIEGSEGVTVGRVVIAR